MSAFAQISRQPVHRVVFFLQNIPQQFNIFLSLNCLGLFFFVGFCIWVDFLAKYIWVLLAQCILVLLAACIWVRRATAAHSALVKQADTNYKR